ncbi:MAG: HAD family hydrolase [Candidatus Omnitrophota bacterium]|jgi:D-sedoheptulose 7-phosphate isomerase
MKKQRVVFLDRDGVINRYPGDRDYVKSWDEFEFLPRVKPALKRLNEKGFRVFIISNQAGVSKGIYTQEALDTITGNMLSDLEAFGINIARVFYCIHRQEDDCACRKPRTGNIEKALMMLRKEGIEPELRKSYFIGDTIRDIETGRAAGLNTILVFSGKEKADNKENWVITPGHTADDLSGAVDLIINAG